MDDPASSRFGIISSKSERLTVSPDLLAQAYAAAGPCHEAIGLEFRLPAFRAVAAACAEMGGLDRDFQAVIHLRTL